MKRKRPTLQKGSRIGIINRGEAAIRFIRAVNEFNALYHTNFTTVAFYLDLEPEALFVKEADEAYLLSQLLNVNGCQGSVYVNKECMVKALLSSHCQAAWVGWGFLSEDAAFADMIEKAGLVFIGPSAQSMALLGDKIAAKELAEKAHVPILPWSKGRVDTIEEARTIAQQIGYPVIVKAANAGGGRGIRFVKGPEELAAQYQAAKEETIRTSCDDTVFVEHLVECGRHLEVQVLADRHGTVKTFGVRDCSVQRRNQKIIEETPPPCLDKKIAAEIEEAATRIMREAHYENAGTVEFIFDVAVNTFYFMEVNTRLQVEHPITEQVYTIDLVKGQIQVAMGQKLDEENPISRGVAIEARLNAEDPDRDFIPAPGRVVLFRIPAGPGVRVDSGIEQGSVIPQAFDSMIAKIIAYAPDRPHALARLKRALKETLIKLEGGTSNKALLLELLSWPEINDGGVHTRFVEDMLKSREQVIHRHYWDIALIACAIEASISRYRDELINFKQQWGRIGQPKNISSSHGYDVSLKAHGHVYSFIVKAMGKDIFHLKIEGQIVTAHYSKRDHDAILVYKNKRHAIQIVPRHDVMQCEIDGIPYPVEIESGDFIKAPCPAIILSIAVQPGQVVKKGDVLFELEAMKILMIIDAPEEGIVKTLCVREGEQIAAGQPLIQLDTSTQTEIKEERVRPRVRFAHLGTYEITHTWHMMERELLAVFLGYDHDKDALSLLERMLEFVKEYPGFKHNIAHCFLSILEIYTAVENLFSHKRIELKNFARPGNYQELLLHFFIRTIDKKKGLPQQFLDSLNRAITWYTGKCADEEERINQALFRIYKSHANLKTKQKVLRLVLFSMKNFIDIQKYRQRISDLLDEITQLTLEQKPSLADAACQMRYHLLDKVFIKNMKNERRAELEELVRLRKRESKDRNTQNILMGDILNTGDYIVFDLLKLALNTDKESRKVALELIGRRFNRDREFISGTIIERDKVLLYHLCSKSEHEDHETIIMVVAPNNCADIMDDVRNYLHDSKPAHNPELIVLALLTAGKEGEEKENPIKYLCNRPLPVCWCCLGLFTEDGQCSYQTFIENKQQKWQKDHLPRLFSPLFYRELKVNLLNNFNLKILYAAESVYLLSAIAKNNEKDERLFALVDLSESLAEVGKDNAIQRIVAFDYAFMEAISAISLEQSKRKQRLFLNRIIIHVHSLLSTNLKQIRDYAPKLAIHTSELGLEEVTIYAHREKKENERLHELELHFKSISKEQFTMRSCTLSSKLLEPMPDNYVSKVSRSKQRGTVYPYEIIKMLINKELGGSYHLGKPGKFEEFDIRINKKKQEGQEVFSVKNRAYGQNTGNIVFGIITNYTKHHPHGCKRVLILVDSTKDMGALTEHECRRVIGALDLAEDRRLSVEWLPISSGAKIDMNSGTENLDWTARALKRIVTFTQAGGEINIIVSGINVGAQSYWNAEATMLMHTKGLLIMTEDAAMLLTGKKALDFSGSVSAENNIGIGGVERIMGPNGQAQIKVKNLTDAYKALFYHYAFTHREEGKIYPRPQETMDERNRDIRIYPYKDPLDQGFTTIGDIFSKEKNPERKKPFAMRQVMQAVIDQDHGFLERWEIMKDAETAIVWETRLGGYALCMIGIESRSLVRLGKIPYDGPESWSGGTLYPQSSKKVARAINTYSYQLPIVILANLSGFDGSPESLRKFQLEFGAEIGRAIVNFRGPIIFVVVARYHGGAYVVFSHTLNPLLQTVALENTYASVIGGAPAAAVIFPRMVLKETYADPRVIEAQKKLQEEAGFTQKDFEDLFQKVYSENQTALGQRFDRIHSVERAKAVGSIDDIISPEKLRPYLIKAIETGIIKFSLDFHK
ncbi:MAG: carboxyl transferase domain-containing protein [bacterium]